MKVVNVRTAAKGTYIYIGRRNGKFADSIFANPFHEGPDGDRAEVIRKYKLHLWRMMKDPEACNELFKLDGRDLGCWCAPLPCHGDVLIAAVAWVKRRIPF